MCIIAYCTIEKNCGKLFWAFTKYCHENLNYHVQWYACYLIHTLATLMQVIVILPTNRKDRYDAIKKVCCVENPGEMCVLVLVYDLHKKIVTL